MAAWRAAIRGMRCGALAGVIAIGVIGRVAMRLVALTKGQAPMFTWAGTAKLLIAAGVGGAIGGLAYALIRLRCVWRPSRLVGPAVGLAAFALVAVGVRAPTFGGTVMIAGCFALYGTLLERCCGGYVT